MAQISNSQDDYFNPSIGTQPENYLGYSKGIDAPSSQKYSSATAGAVQGLGDLWGLMVNGADTVIKEDIKDDAYDYTQKVTDDSIGSMLQQEVPSDITKAGKKIGLLDQAAKAGKVSDTRYNILIDAESRRLKERYPGHKEFVDRMFQTYTKQNTASDVRTSMKADIAAANNTKSNELKYIETHGAWISDATMTRLHGGEDIPFSDILLESSRNQRSAALVTQHNAEADQYFKDDKVAVDKRKKALSSELDDVFLNALTPKLTEYHDAEKAANDKPGGPKGEDIQSLQIKANAIRTYISDNVQKVAYGGGRSKTKYALLMPAEDLKAVTDSYMELAKHVGDAVTDPQSGMAVAGQMALKAKQADADNDINLNQTAKATGAMNRTFGAQLTQSIIIAASNNTTKTGVANQKNGRNTPMDALAGLTTIFGIEGTANGQTKLNDHTDTLTQKGMTEPKSLTDYVDGLSKGLQSKDTDPAKKLNIINNLFDTSGEFLKNMDTKTTGIDGKVKITEKAKMFNRLTTPENLKAVYDTGDPKAIGQAENFVIAGTNVTAGTAIGDMKTSSDAGVKFTYDPMFHRFDVAKGQGEGFAPRGSANGSGAKLSLAQHHADAFNAAIRPMVNMLEARGEKDIDGQLFNSLRPLGFDIPVQGVPPPMKLGGPQEGRQTPTEGGGNYPDILPRGRITGKDANGTTLTSGSGQQDVQDNPIALLREELGDALKMYKANPTPETERYARTIFDLATKAKEKQDALTTTMAPEGQFQEMKSGLSDKNTNYLDRSSPTADSYMYSAKPGADGKAIDLPSKPKGLDDSVYIKEKGKITGYLPTKFWHDWKGVADPLKDPEGAGIAAAEMVRTKEEYDGVRQQLERYGPKVLKAYDDFFPKKDQPEVPIN